LSWIICYAIIGHVDVFWVLQCALLGTIPSPDGWTYDILPLAVELTTTSSGRHPRDITHRYMSFYNGENDILFKADQSIAEYVNMLLRYNGTRMKAPVGVFGLLRFYTGHVMLRR